MGNGGYFLNIQNAKLIVLKPMHYIQLYFKYHFTFSIFALNNGVHR